MDIIEINCTDNIFPKQLLSLKHSPKKLFAIGNLDLFKEDLFSVVGTRKITEYGVKYGKKICKELVLRDIPLVSGLAIGTDTLVHNTCLEYDGKTIAVLPCGFNKIYPKENINLFEKIIKNNGLVLTEYEHNVDATSKSFIERNRVIMALGKGLLVIEAMKRSGTSVTADLAFKSNKKVYAIPRKSWK